MWQCVTSGNGFSADESLVQHSTTPFTGTYGVVLLGGLAKLFSLLKISRAQDRGFDDGTTTIEAFVWRALAVDADTAARRRALCQAGWSAPNTATR